MPQAERGGADEGPSARFLSLLEDEPLARLTALDVGTGRGRLALWLATRCRRVVGIDIDSAAIGAARQRAAATRLPRVEFVVADAETGEYGEFAPDLVTAHLCMSDAIVERAGRGLPATGVLAFIAFHADQWRETGRRSRFAYDEDQARDVLGRAGFAVEHLDVEHHVQEFRSVEEGLAAAVGLEERWRVDGRWLRYLRFLQEGGRTLTRSHLVVKARRR